MSKKKSLYELSFADGGSGFLGNMIPGEGLELLDVPEDPKMVLPKKKKFGEAFAEARKSGLKEFEWNGNRYTTQYKEEVQPSAPSKKEETKKVAPVQTQPKKTTPIVTVPSKPATQPKKEQPKAEQPKVEKQAPVQQKPVTQKPVQKQTAPVKKTELPSLTWSAGKDESTKLTTPKESIPSKPTEKIKKPIVKTVPPAKAVPVQKETPKATPIVQKPIQKTPEQPKQQVPVKEKPKVEQPTYNYDNITFAPQISASESTDTQNITKNIKPKAQQTSEILQNTPWEQVYPKAPYPSDVKKWVDTKKTEKTVLPYSIISKIENKLYLFDRDHNKMGEYPILRGKDKGDYPNTVDADKSLIDQEGKATTPGGRYKLGNTLTDDPSYNALGGFRGFKMEGNSLLGLHPTWDAATRQWRYDTETVKDNFASYGCVNCQKEDYDKINKTLTPGSDFIITNEPPEQTGTISNSDQLSDYMSGFGMKQGGKFMKNNKKKSLYKMSFVEGGPQTEAEWLKSTEGDYQENQYYEKLMADNAAAEASQQATATDIGGVVANTAAPLIQKSTQGGNYATTGKMASAAFGVTAATGFNPVVAGVAGGVVLATAIGDTIANSQAKKRARKTLEDQFGARKEEIQAGSVYNQPVGYMPEGDIYGFGAKDGGKMNLMSMSNKKPCMNCGGKHMAEGGQYGMIAGNGNSKADDEQINLKEGSFVVPNDTDSHNDPKIKFAQSLIDWMGYNPNKKIQPNASGGGNINISDKELVLSPEQTQRAEVALGGKYNMEKMLSPNSDYNQAFAANGGFYDGGRRDRKYAHLFNEGPPLQTIDEIESEIEAGNMSDKFDNNISVNPTNTESPNIVRKSTETHGINTTTTAPESVEFDFMNQNKIDRSSILQETPFDKPLQYLEDNSITPNVDQKKKVELGKGFSTESSYVPPTSYISRQQSKTPDTSQSPDLESQYAKAISDYMNVGKVVTAGATLWNLTRKRTPGVAPERMIPYVPEVNTEAMRTEQTKQAEKASRTARYFAREMGGGPMASAEASTHANELENRGKIAAGIEQIKNRAREYGAGIINNAKATNIANMMNYNTQESAAQTAFQQTKADSLTAQGKGLMTLMGQGANLKAKELKYDRQVGKPLRDAEADDEYSMWVANNRSGKYNSEGFEVDNDGNVIPSKKEWKKQKGYK